MTMMSTEESHFTNAKTYLPERWLRENKDAEAPASVPSPFAFLPFGFGPRSCVGRRFAEMENEILIIRYTRIYIYLFTEKYLTFAISLVFCENIESNGIMGQWNSL